MPTIKDDGGTLGKDGDAAHGRIDAFQIEALGEPGRRAAIHIRPVGG
jgi:hypothetical protein